jgi:hypothetical protein
VLRIKNSKTDQVGDGATVLVLLRTADHDWRELWATYWAGLPADVASPLFLSTRQGQPGSEPLTKGGVGAVLKKVLKDMQALGWYSADLG